MVSIPSYCDNLSFEPWSATFIENYHGFTQLLLRICLDCKAMASSFHILPNTVTLPFHKPRKTRNRNSLRITVSNVWMCECAQMDADSWILHDAVALNNSNEGKDYMIISPFFF